MRRMLDKKELEGLGGGGGGGGEIHLYDVQIWSHQKFEFYLSFVSTKILPGFTKPGDTLRNKSMKDYPEFFPKVDIPLPCSGAVKKDNTFYPCVSINIVVDSYDSNGYVMPKIIYNNNLTTTTIVPTNGTLNITRRY